MVWTAAMILLQKIRYYIYSESQKKLSYWFVQSSDNYYILHVVYYNWNAFSFSFRLFKNPVPGEVVIFSEVTTFRIAVERHLKSKCRLPVTINFRGDVYRFLFKNKGHYQDGWHLLDKVAFPNKFFPEFWDHCPDSHGQGIKVFYPMKVRSFISWSPKKYSVGEGHHQCPRAFQEKLTLLFVRVALGATS